MLTYKSLESSIKVDGVYRTLLKIYYSFFKVQKFFVFFRDPNKLLQLEMNNAGKDHKLDIRQVEIRELERIRTNNKALPSEFYCDLTFGFKTPYVAFLNNDVAAIHWLVRKGENSRFFDLGKGDLELNYTFVIPKFRGLRLSQNITAMMLSDVCGKGYKRFLTATNMNNIAQYRPFIRLGFEPVEILHQSPFNRKKANLKYLRK